MNETYDSRCTDAPDAPDAGLLAELDRLDEAETAAFWAAVEEQEREVAA